MDIANLKEEIKKFNLDRNWNQYHSVKNLSMALSVESSELLEIFQWMSEDESNKLSQSPEGLKKVKHASEEVADIFLYLLQISMKLEIDLESAVSEKLKSNAEKYPVEKSFGKSIKYDQF